MTELIVNAERWITSSEAAAMAGISLSYVAQLSRECVWPSVKYRRTRYIDREALEDWLRERRAVEEKLAG